MTTPADGPSVLPIRRPGVISRTVADGVVVIHPGTQQAHALTGAPAKLWQALEDGLLPTTSPAELNRAVAELELLDLIETRGVSRRTMLMRSGVVVAATGIASIGLPEVLAAASPQYGFQKSTPGAISTLVPAGMTRVKITLVGGSGGSGQNTSFAPGGSGGGGETLSFTVTLNNPVGGSGVVITGWVGGGGGAGSPTGGAGGAGAGSAFSGAGGKGGAAGSGTGSTNTTSPSGGGGGGAASFVNVPGLATPTAVAAGGGGGGAAGTNANVAGVGLFTFAGGNGGSAGAGGSVGGHSAGTGGAAGAVGSGSTPTGVGSDGGTPANAAQYDHGGGGGGGGYAGGGGGGASTNTAVIGGQTVAFGPYDGGGGGGGGANLIPTGGTPGTSNPTAPSATGSTGAAGASGSVTIAAG